MPKQQVFDFMEAPEAVSATTAAAPAGYKGLYGFHKYWGKKPHEPLAFVIEKLTKPNAVVLDPFVGSGTTAREALLRGRRFIGFDINPVAIALTRMLTRPPQVDDMRDALSEIERAVKDQILNSYRLNNGQLATHFLWEEGDIVQVWARGLTGRAREERQPMQHDHKLSESFKGYQSRYMRCPQFFSNGRINTAPEMSLDDIMTGRAQRNLDLLLEAINDLPSDVRSALMLCLTAASGQMTKMVFAVTGRGKMTGKKASRIEVGSWVIGYWRPKLHFEVNAWNCFEHRTSKLIRALKDGDPLGLTRISDAVGDVLNNEAQSHLFCGDCRHEMKALPDQSIDLVIADPFEREIVFSNAKERGKSAESYAAAMTEFFDLMPRVLSPSGFLVVLFNARQREQWAALRGICNSGKGRHQSRETLNYVGRFPCVYSAGSVVQDSRRGSLKSDYALVFAKQSLRKSSKGRFGDLCKIPGWSRELPDHLT
ncbi:MAG: type II modification methylase [Gammaproteobacteria bacterium AqS3]|nr:type II modification methylase [Gammaproteobacteria bacterium AqS3]